MPPRPVVARGKKKGPSKEEVERLAKEAELKQIRDAMITQERDAERFQMKHDLQRDEHDTAEAFRIQREKELKELHDSKLLIDGMNAKMSKLTEEIELERGDTEKELNRLRHLVERGTNDFATFKKEAYQNEMQQQGDRERIIDQNVSLESQMVKARAHIASLQQDLTRLEQVSEKESAGLRKELAESRERHLRDVSELELKNRNLQRETATAKQLSASQQEMLAQREADDRKNTNLLQLMNQQLDESKKRQHEFLEDEKRRNRQLSAELETLRANFANVQDEARVIKQEADAIKRDAAAFNQTLKRSASDTAEWKDKAKSELDEFKKEIRARLEETLRQNHQLASGSEELAAELVAAKQHISDLEKLLRKKETQMNDRVAFLSAQIASERAMIRDLLQEIAQQNDNLSDVVANYEEQLHQKQFAVSDMSQSLIRQMETSNLEREHELRIRQANDAHFRGRIQDLETELQRKNVLKISESTGESEFDVAMKEIGRLEAILDQHHIVHRNMPAPNSIGNKKDGENSFIAPRPPSNNAAKRTGAANADGNNNNNSGNNNNNDNNKELESENKSLRMKLEKSMKDQEVQRRISLEVETRLNSQVKNLHDVVDALHNELAESKQESLEKIYNLEKALAAQEEDNRNKNSISGGSPPQTRPPPIPKKPDSAASTGSAEFEL